MVESELLIARLRAKKLIAVAVIVLAFVSVLVTIYGLHARASRRAHYAESVRKVGTDIRSLEKGIRSDALALVNAFDDEEVMSLVADQSKSWTHRARRCAALREELARLVPDSRHMELEALLVTLSVVTDDVNRSFEARDPGLARAAVKTIGDQSSEKARLPDEN
jgi:hypothetical protein